MNSSLNFLQNIRQRVNRKLQQQLGKLRTTPVLGKALQYVIQGGGKRLRALLIYTVGQAYGAKLTSLDLPAVAIELVHAFSLVHDDLPAMDNDDLRHGKLTCHRAFNEATAILTGDALVIFAFQLLTSLNLPDRQIVQVIQILAKATGPTGMINGQMLDLLASGQQLTIPQLLQLYQLKTGALIAAAMQIGAIVAGMVDRHELAKLNRLAIQLGLAFQIQDDLLNIEGDPQKLGKNVHTDQQNNKFTYPRLTSLVAAKEQVTTLYGLSKMAVQKLQMINNQQLLALIDYMQVRDF